MESTMWLPLVAIFFTGLRRGQGPPPYLREFAPPPPPGSADCNRTDLGLSLQCKCMIEIVIGCIIMYVNLTNQIYASQKTMK